MSRPRNPRRHQRVWVALLDSVSCGVVQKVGGGLVTVQGPRYSFRIARHRVFQSEAEAERFIAMEVLKRG